MSEAAENGMQATQLLEVNEFATVQRSEMTKARCMAGFR